jgi:hypothetical protein
MAAGNRSVNSAGPRVKVGGRKPAHEDMIFGTDAEVEDRDPNKSLYSEFLPNTNHPTFQQIKPESTSGRTVNRASYTRKGGDFKFSSGPGKP